MHWNMGTHIIISFLLWYNICIELYETQFHIIYPSPNFLQRSISPPPNIFNLLSTFMYIMRDEIIIPVDFLQLSEFQNEFKINDFNFCKGECFLHKFVYFMYILSAILTLYSFVSLLLNICIVKCAFSCFVETYCMIVW